MNIIFKTIPHKEHRYPTCGDWWYEGNDLHIRVSEMGDWRYEALVGAHELMEVLMCKHDGVTQKQVDDFDMEYEKNRQADDDSEPGDSPKAPYRKQHLIATGIEKIMAAMLGVVWTEYEAAINALFE